MWRWARRHLGRVPPPPRALQERRLTPPVESSRVEDSSRIEDSSRVESSRVESSRVESRRVASRRVASRRVASRRVQHEERGPPPVIGGPLLAALTRLGAQSLTPPITLLLLAALSSRQGQVAQVAPQEVAAGQNPKPAAPPPTRRVALAEEGRAALRRRAHRGRGACNLRRRRRSYYRHATCLRRRHLPDNAHMGPGLVSIRVTHRARGSMRVAWGPGLVGSINVWYREVASWWRACRSRRARVDAAGLGLG